MKEKLYIRMTQWSTWMGIVTALAPVLVGGWAAVPNAVGTILAGLGLIAVNA